MNPVVVELAIGRRAEVIFDVAGTFDRVGIDRAALEFVEQCAVRLAHHLGQHVETAAMRHADDDLLHTEIAAALDDLLERRDQRFPAVQAEALGARELQVAEFLKTLGLDELVEDRAPALWRERDFLVRPLDTLLNPGLLRGIGDVHELDAERLAISALANCDDLAKRAVFEAEHVIEENLAVEIGLGEAVTARIELFAVARRLDPERIELGVKMPAHAVGADQHQGTNGVAGSLMHVGGDDFGSLLNSPGLRLRGELGGDGLLDFDPVPVERGGQIITRREGPVAPAPRRTLGVFTDVAWRVLQALEARLPL